MGSVEAYETTKGRRYRALYLYIDPSPTNTTISSWMALRLATRPELRVLEWATCSAMHPPASRPMSTPISSTTTSTLLPSRSTKRR